MSGGADDARKERERRFHDQRFTVDTRRSASKYYAIDAGSVRYRQLLDAIAPGRRVLEYGCGLGGRAYDLASRGCRVTAIDISPVAIAESAARAAALGLSIDFREMDAEKLAFADRSFDVVCGSGILHHLDLERAFAEIARVLDPGGEAVFMEPLGHNPLINLYRRLTPGMRTEDEHPLVASDVATAQRFFARAEAQPFDLLALAGVPLQRLPGGRRLVGMLHRLDRQLFARSALARRWAWVVVLALGGPRPD